MGNFPRATKVIYKYYSPTFRLAASELLLVVFYLIISIKKLKELNKDYFKVAIPTGVFYALANISQKIGLMYTTSAKYAFLEHSYVIIVPILSYLLIRKKPTVLTVISAVMCLFSVFLLNMTELTSGSMLGIGELLCLIGGLLYAGNIAGTGAYAKKFYAPLYLMIQAAVTLVISGTFSIVLNIIKKDGQPLEKIRFSFGLVPLIYFILLTLVVSAFCWIIRTNCMKYVDASTVSIIMTLSCVIAAFISVVIGEQPITRDFVLGGSVCIIALLIPGIGEKLSVSKKSKTEE